MNEERQAWFTSEHSVLAASFFPLDVLEWNEQEALGLNRLGCNCAPLFEASSFSPVGVWMSASGESGRCGNMIRLFSGSNSYCFIRLACFCQILESINQ